MRQTAIGIIVVTTIFMIIPLIGLFDDPWGLIKKHWDVYLLFVVIPYGIAGALLFASRRGPKAR